MEELIQHWSWNVDIESNIYSLFVLTVPPTCEYDPCLHGQRYLYYSHAFYVVEDNLWEITSQRELPPLLMVAHDGFLYGVYHNINTDFEYSVEVSINGRSKIEETIMDLCNFSSSPEPSVRPSIDDGGSGLWYPDNLEDIFRWPPERLDAFLEYISKKGDDKHDSS